MKIDLNKGNPTFSSKSGKIATGGTVISQNLKKQSVFVDLDGNQIDPRTKVILKRKDKLE